MCIIADVQVFNKKKQALTWYTWRVLVQCSWLKKPKTLKESLIEKRVGKIEKDRKIVIFRMSFSGHTEIEYLWDSNDEVRPLSS